MGARVLVRRVCLAQPPSHYVGPSHWGVGAMFRKAYPVSLIAHELEILLLKAQCAKKDVTTLERFWRKRNELGPVQGAVRSMTASD